MACSKNGDSILGVMELQEGIEGKDEYLSSSFVTAGDRTYVVGHQNGSFPDQGWHVQGEMGGIWSHPIKLMDGYSLNISSEKTGSWCLDSAFHFTNYPVGNSHLFKNQYFKVTRTQFVPEKLEGLVVVFEIQNRTSEQLDVDLNFTGMVDLSPVWLAEELNITDGLDSGVFDHKSNAYIARDVANSWFVVFGSDQNTSTSQAGYCTIDRRGNGKDLTLLTKVKVGGNESRTVKYFISGSSQSEQDARETYDFIYKNHLQLLREKIELYEKVNETNQLTINDKNLEQMFRWTQYNSQWLVRDVPEIGRGLSAGIPDYPWWFGTDNGYTIQGLLAAGMHKEALATIDLILKLSRQENGNGRIVHEVSTNGVVFNPGNLNTTPNFIYALWKAYEWTGESKLAEDYFDDVKKGIEWIESVDINGNGYPDGAGMMEIHGLESEMIDVVVYLTKAYQAAANFAIVMGENELHKTYSNKASKLREQINSQWWVPESNSYADFRSTKKEAQELVEAASVRADTINKPWSVEELIQTRKKIDKSDDTGINSYVVHHNWVVNTPLEMGLADADKAKIALETAKKYTNRFGMFVTGIDRDENQIEAQKWKAFSYVGAVMTLPTGVQAIAEAKYGNPDASLEYLDMLKESFGFALPGSMYEVSPDFGMITQAWNIYAVAIPIVNHFFGIYPMAHKKRVVITPNFPTSWENAQISNVKIGENNLSVRLERTDGKEIYLIEQTEDWTLTFEVSGNSKVVINSQRLIKTVKEKIWSINLTGNRHEIEVIR